MGYSAWSSAAALFHVIESAEASPSHEPVLAVGLGSFCHLCAEPGPSCAQHLQLAVPGASATKAVPCTNDSLESIFGGRKCLAWSTAWSLVPVFGMDPQKER